ncbi:MAG: OsmC family peroxiredoxin [Anaerolineales bacterium]
MTMRQAEAIWEGDLRQGRGRVRLPSSGHEAAYSYSSRFDDGAGTDPEELLGAAHAGCFSMSLAGGVAKRGFTAERIATTAQVNAERIEGRFTITSIHLDTSAVIPGLSEAQFSEAAEEAKATCPISRALSGIPITLQAKLERASSG